MNLDSDYISDLMTELETVMKKLTDFQEDETDDLVEIIEQENVASLSELIDSLADLQYTYELAIGKQKEGS